MDRPFDTATKNVVPIWKVMDLQHREGGLGFDRGGYDWCPPTLVEYGYFSENRWVFPSKIIHGLIGVFHGFSIIFTIHFGV